MSLISEIVQYVYKNDRKEMINICSNFVESFYKTIDDKKLTIKSNLFETYFFIIWLVIRSYSKKRNKLIAEHQINLFIKEIFYHIWQIYIENNTKIATQMFDISDYIFIDNITINTLFPIFTKKLTERVEYYTYSIILDKDDKSYKETIKSFIELTFGFKLIDKESASLRSALSTAIISNAINITENSF